MSDAVHQLPCAVRSARTNAVRSLKILVEDGPQGAALGQATLLPEAFGASLHDEFARCVIALADASPCLFLFRADNAENVDGSRWLLVAWIPFEAPAADRVVCNSCVGLLARLVPHPYFLREFVAKDRAELTLAKAFAGAHPSTAVACSLNERAHSGSSHDMIVDIEVSETASALLTSLAKGDELGIQIWFTVDPHDEGSQPRLLDTLEGQVCGSRSVTQLAHSALSTSSCYYALLMPDHLLFVLWNPDPGGAQRLGRAAQMARSALLKATVLDHVLRPFGRSTPRVVQVDAQEAQDLMDSAPLGARHSLPTIAARTAVSIDRSKLATRGAGPVGAFFCPEAASAKQPTAVNFHERPLPSRLPSDWALRHG